MNPAEQMATIERVPRSTARQRVLIGLTKVLQREGSASIREIGEACGLTSTSSVAYHLNKLVDSGHVQRPVRNRPRGWHLTVLGVSAVDEMAAALRARSGRGRSQGTVAR